MDKYYMPMGKNREIDTHVFIPSLKYHNSNKLSNSLIRLHNSQLNLRKEEILISEHHCYMYSIAVVRKKSAFNP